MVKSSCLNHMRSLAQKTMNCLNLDLERLWHFSQFKFHLPVLPALTPQNEEQSKNCQLPCKRMTHWATSNQGCQKCLTLIIGMILKLFKMVKLIYKSKCWRCHLMLKIKWFMLWCQSIAYRVKKLKWAKCVLA